MAQDPDTDRIAAKAHELWEAEGRPHGRDQDHWDQAREMVAIEDSQGATLLPRDTGVEEPIEEPDVALRNMADVPNLTDQGENLLTSTDREPDLTATPAGRRGRMPKSEVPTSDQPGIPPKSKKNASKAATPEASAQPAAPVAVPAEVAAQPEAVSAPEIVKPDAVKPKASAKADAPKKAGGRKKFV